MHALHNLNNLHTTPTKIIKSRPENYGVTYCFRVITTLLLSDCLEGHFIAEVIPVFSIPSYFDG